MSLDTRQAIVLEFSTETAHRRYSVHRERDLFVLALHTIWDADGSETFIMNAFPTEAIGPLATLLNHALLELPPPDSGGQ